MSPMEDGIDPTREFELKSLENFVKIPLKVDSFNLISPPHFQVIQVAHCLEVSNRRRNCAAEEIGIQITK